MTTEHEIIEEIVDQSLRAVGYTREEVLEVWYNELDNPTALLIRLADGSELMVDIMLID